MEELNALWEVSIVISGKFLVLDGKQASASNW